MISKKLPPKKKGWNHSDQVIVYYEPNECHSATCSIAYYHYKPPHDGPKWVDHSGRDHEREPSYWWPVPELPLKK